MTTVLMKLRVKKGLSRYRVAKDTGIPYTNLERLETTVGDRVNVRHVQTLAEYYGVEFNIKELLK